MERPQLGLPVGGDARLSINQDTSLEDVIDAAEESSFDTTTSETTSVYKYEEEWKWLRDQDENMMELRQQALQGDLRASRLRSICWRLLLGVLSAGKPQDWLKETKESRNCYFQLRNRLSVDPWQGHALPDDNPLSQKDESLWHQHFCDKELKNVIKQDVMRTFPGVDFFRDERIQEIMVNVLFCYARDHPEMCYRQGMHEILAPLLFVIHCDHQNFLHAKELNQLCDETSELLDPNYVEEDCYALFIKVMFAIQGSYHIENVAPSNTGYFPNSSYGPVNENKVLQQLNWIRDNILAPSEPEILKHLENLDIPLPLFGIRWLRLMFGREFPLHDLLVLWDAIFADCSMCELVNYLVVSMLSAIKNKLLGSDYAASLSILMRYPTSVDVSHIIDNALCLKNSEITQRPVPQPSQPIPVHQKHDKHCSSHNKNSTTKRLKKSSMKSNSQSDTTRYVDNSSVIDGLIVDDIDSLRSELKRCHAVMSLVQLKLAQYHNVLEECLPPENIPAQQVLTGIHELCSLLNPHQASRSPSLCVEVEPACEAGEMPSTSSNLPPPRTKVMMTTFKEMQGHPFESTDCQLPSVNR